MKLKSACDVSFSSEYEISLLPAILPDYFSHCCFPLQERGGERKRCGEKGGCGGRAEGSSGSGSCTLGGPSQSVQGHAAGERGKTLQRNTLTSSVMLDT